MVCQLLWGVMKMHRIGGDPNNKDLEELLELLEAREELYRYNKIDYLFPDEGPFRRELYPQHVKFMNAGANYSQRAFIAGNRTGKTKCGAAECAYHLTGLYPHWWKGKRFINPVKMWAVGISNEKTREVQQFELLGEINDLGTGLIPKHLLVGKPKMKPSVPDTVGSFYVKHVTGGVSKCEFKAYEQGRDAFQGTKQDVIWLDEEPRDVNIYSECLTRLMDPYFPGIILCTFTPLFGVSDVVRSFIPDNVFPENGVDPSNPYKFIVNVGWEDVPHLSEEQKTELLASYSIHERDARSKGRPSLGAGAIYPYLEEDISCDYFDLPESWPRAYGMDVGWNITGALWGAMDPNDGVVYIYSEHYMGKEQPAVHASSIKARGEWIEGACDPAAEKDISPHDGKNLLELYEDLGLNIVPANNAREAGLLQVSHLLASGRLKIFNTLQYFWKEYRGYHRDENGKLVKKNDHLMDCMRYLVMTGISLMNVKPDPEMEATRYTPPNRDKYTGY